MGGPLYPFFGLLSSRYRQEWSLEIAPQTDSPGAGDSYDGEHLRQFGSFASQVSYRLWPPHLGSAPVVYLGSEVR